jgi:hypothetical protein
MSWLSWIPGLIMFGVYRVLSWIQGWFPMSQKKKAVREAFRTAVFDRDGHKCRMCGKPGYDRQRPPEKGKVPIDAHHICDRSLLPNQGYCKENGISLCDDGCHLKAEAFHQTGVALSGFSQDELYALIGSSFEKAKAASLKL